jgi:hypothetical protein
MQQLTNFNNITETSTKLQRVGSLCPPPLKEASSLYLQINFQNSSDLKLQGSLSKRMHSASAGMKENADLQGFDQS